MGIPPSVHTLRGRFGCSQQQTVCEAGKLTTRRCFCFLRDNATAVQTMQTVSCIVVGALSATILPAEGPPSSMHQLGVEAGEQRQRSGQACTVG